MEAVCVKEGFSGSSRVNKTLRYFWIIPSALTSKTETTKMEQQKLNVVLEVLNELFAVFLETKQFAEKHLQQRCLKENISAEDFLRHLFSFDKPRNKTLAQQTFLLCSVRF